MSHIMPMRKVKSRTTTGGITALAAALLFVLFGFALLVLYATSGFGVHMELQNAVDAATLSLANKAAAASVSLGEVDTKLAGDPLFQKNGRVQANCSYFLNGLGSGPNKDKISLGNLNDVIGSVLLLSADIEDCHFIQSYIYILSTAGRTNAGSPPAPIADQIYIPEQGFNGTDNPNVELFSDPFPQDESLHRSVQAVVKLLKEKLGLDSSQENKELFRKVIAQNPARLFGLLPAHTQAKLDMTSLKIEPVYYKVAQPGQTSNIKIMNDSVPNMCLMRGSFFPSQPPGVTALLPAPQPLEVSTAWLLNPLTIDVPANTNLLKYGIYALPANPTGNLTLAHLIPVREANQYLLNKLPEPYKTDASRGVLLPNAVKVTANFIDPNTKQTLTFYAAAELPFPATKKVAKIPNGHVKFSNSILSYTDVRETYDLSPNLPQFGMTESKRFRVIRRGIQKWDRLPSQTRPTVAQDGQWPNEIVPGEQVMQGANQDFLVSMYNQPDFASFVLPSSIDPTVHTDGTFGDLVTQVALYNPVRDYRRIELARYVHQFAPNASIEEIEGVLSTTPAPVATHQVPTVTCLREDPNRSGHVAALNADLPGMPPAPGEPEQLKNRIRVHCPLWAIPPAREGLEPPFQIKTGYLGRYNPDFIRRLAEVGAKIRGYDVNKPSTFPELYDELSIDYFPGMNNGQLLQYTFGTEGFQNIP